MISVNQEKNSTEDNLVITSDFINRITLQIPLKLMLMDILNGLIHTQTQQRIQNQ